MASIKLDKTNEKTSWGDLVLEEEEKAPASAGAGTPQKEEKGWTEVNAPKKDKSKSRTKDSAPAGPVAKKLDFGSTNLSNNKFAALADSSDDDE